MKFLLSIAFMLSLSFSTLSAQVDFPGIDKSPMDMAYYPSRVAFRAFGKTDAEKNAKPIIRLIYSRPMKNNRVVFGELIKYGEIWRVGANESTEVLFFQDVTVNGTMLKAGRYTLYAVPNKDSWEIHFSTDTDGWGHYSFNPEISTVAKITVPTKKTDSTIEALSIVFTAADKGANMIIAWDDTMVSVPIEF